MAKTDPKLYQKYLTDEKGKKVLYLRLQKAIYGMMKSAFLFYRKLISELKEMGFEVQRIQSLHCQQDSEREPDDHLMACG